MVTMTGPINSFFESSMWLFFMAMFVIQLVALILVCYIYYHVGKTIKLAETKTQVKLESYIADILLLWFLLIGIWFIQPRLNKLIKDDYLNNGTLLVHELS